MPCLGLPVPTASQLGKSNITKHSMGADHSGTAFLRFAFLSCFMVIDKSLLASTKLFASGTDGGPAVEIAGLWMPSRGIAPGRTSLTISSLLSARAAKPPSVPGLARKVVHSDIAGRWLGKAL